MAKKSLLLGKWRTFDNRFRRLVGVPYDGHAGGLTGILDCLAALRAVGGSGGLPGGRASLAGGAAPVEVAPAAPAVTQEGWNIYK